MRRRAYLWSIGLCVGLPILVMAVFSLVTSLPHRAGGCSEAGGGLCVGIAFGFLFVVLFAIPLLLLVGTFLLVLFRCGSTGVPRAFSIPAGVFALTLPYLALLPDQLRLHDQPAPWTVAENAAGPLCLFALLTFLAFLPDQPSPVQGRRSTILPWCGVWISAAIVAFFVPFAVFIRPLFEMQSALRRSAPEWPWLVLLAVLIFAGCLAIILVRRRAMRYQTA